MPTALVLALVLITAPQISGPGPEPQSDPLSIKAPRGTGDLLKLASELNGLDDTSNTPWHIELTYDHFDEDGDNDHSGAVEEFYAGPKKYKRIIVSDTLNQTDVADGSHLYRTGDQVWPGGSVMHAINAVLHPLRDPRPEDKSIRIEKTDLKFGNLSLPCVTLRRTGDGIIYFGRSVFCFNNNSVMLRFAQPKLAGEARYDNLVPFHGRYVAKDISVTRSGKTILKIHVEELGEIGQVSDTFFSAPSGSIGPVGGRIAIPADVFMDFLISDVQPDYPRGSDGKTLVRFVVGKDGKVIEATAEGGPEPVRKAAAEAVRKYRFRPYLVLDQPVEVKSSSSFEFH